MKIFSKKSFQFDHQSGEVAPVVVQHNDFAIVPDWVEESAMFKLALADGDVSIIETKADESATEKGDKEAKSVAAKAAVAAAESEPNQLILDEAYDLVNDLPKGSSKTGLLKKLDAVVVPLEEKPIE